MLEVYYLIDRLICFIPTLLLTCEAKVVCFLKIWWRLNEALLNYLEAINIGMKSTLMKEGDLMISMVIKAGMCALHVVTSFRECTLSL